MTQLQSLGTKIDSKDTQTNDRMRQDFGDIDSLANSIREHGLIQKIVLTAHENEIRLLVGERRLRALRKLGLSHLVLYEHFLWEENLSGHLDGEMKLRQQGVELEENVRRKDLSWQEQVLGKQRLLNIMHTLYGEARSGAPTTMQRLGGAPQGFGVNKLAAMLGESNAATSKDLELARLITTVPQLAKAETKEAARRQASLGLAVALSQIAQAKNPPKTDKKWTLYEGDFTVNSVNISDGSVDLVIVDPPYGEDTSGMGPNSRELITAPFADNSTTMLNIISDLAKSAWRVLRPDSFAAFFFDFICYGTWLNELAATGFDVDFQPLIWVKNNVINTSPYTRYGRSYEPILVARKGSPKLFRPSQRDVIQINTVTVASPHETKFYHAQKPVELIEKFILDMTAPGGTVVDFCAGSGTTGVAALRQKRQVVLFEKDAQACQIIRTRLGGL